MDSGHETAKGIEPAGSLAERVRQATGTSPLNCYQCGRCAAGCVQNLPGEMDISPTRMMHLLQLESAFFEEKQTAEEYARRALGAESCWLCAGCLACTTRCPQGVDIAGTMDVLRQEGLKRGKAAKTRRVKDIQALHKTFVNGAVNHGRVHELFLIMGYKLRTGHLLADAMLGPAMFRKGKLHVWPGKRPDTKKLKEAVVRFRSSQETKRGRDGGTKGTGGEAK